MCFGWQFQDSTLVSVDSGLNIKTTENMVKATPFMVEESNQREDRKAPGQDGVPKDTAHALI